MRLVESRGTLANASVVLQGIEDNGEIIAVKVIDPSDNSPISWAMSDKALDDVKRILEKEV